MEDTVSKSAYIEGRLKGLNELVGILKDSMESPDTLSSVSINKTIIRHISAEVESILADLQEHHGEHPTLAEAQVAQKSLAKAAAPASKEISIPMMKKQVDAADELMQSLSQFKQKGKYFDEAAEDAEK